MQHGVALCRFLGVSMDWMFLGETLEAISYPTDQVLLTMELTRKLQSHPPEVTGAIIQHPLSTAIVGVAHATHDFVAFLAFCARCCRVKFSY